MKKNERNELLAKLLQSSVNAMHAYDLMLPKVDDDIIRDRLRDFRETHTRHLRELTLAMDPQGEVGSTLKTSPDLKGYIMEGWAVLRSLSGTKSALKSLHSLEEIIYRDYSDALSRHVSEAEHDLFRKQFSDIKIHLDYLTINLQAMGKEG